MTVPLALAAPAAMASDAIAVTSAAASFAALVGILPFIVFLLVAMRPGAVAHGHPSPSRGPRRRRMARELSSTRGTAETVPTPCSIRLGGTLLRRGGACQASAPAAGATAPCGSRHIRHSGGEARPSVNYSRTLNPWRS